MDGIRNLKRRSLRYCQRLLHREDSSKEITEFTSRIGIETKSINWVVENIYGCPLKVDEYLESPVFRTGVREVTSWRLKLYPKGRNSSTENMVGLFLCKITPSTRNNITVTLRVINGDLKSFSKETQQEDHYYGIVGHVCEEPEEIGTDELMEVNDLLAMESVKILCTMHVGYLCETEATEDTVAGPSGFGCNCTLSSDFKDMYSNGLYTDAVFLVDKKKFPVHKAVLAARSPVLAAMFKNDMKESATNSVTLENIDPSDMDSVLQHVYAGKIADMSVEKAIQLYPIADMYELFQLKEECTSVMLRNLSVASVCSIAVLADMYSAPELESATNLLFRDYSSQILEKEEWEDLCVKRPRLAHKITKFLFADHKAKYLAQK